MKRSKENSRRGGRSTYRIGLIADTHDVDDPAAVVAALARQRCDYNVHLGDIGGSREVMNVVRQFKQHLGDGAHLPEDQRQQYHDAMQRGVAPLRAYIETVVGNRNMAERVAETGSAYRAVLAGMATMANPLVLRGNVDGMQLRSPDIQASFAESALQLVDRPRMIDLDWLGIVLWPSSRPANDTEQAALAEAAAALAAQTAQKTHVVVLAHEHFFRGPRAAVYTDRVARAGLQQLTVPRFDPSPSWRCLMQFFRALPAAVRAYYVFGHVHDTLEVMVAGAPALRNPNGPGMRYRLYGLSWRGAPRVATTHSDSTDRAHRGITMLPVALNDVAILGLRQGRETISWQVERYDRATR